MPENIMSSYLYELKPYIDKKKWQKASGDIEQVIKSTPIKYDEWKKQKDAYKEQVKQISELKRELEDLDRLAEKASGKELRRINSLRGYEYRNGVKTAYGSGGVQQQLDSLMERAATNRTMIEASSGSVSGLSKVTSGVTKFASGITAAVGSVISFEKALEKTINTSMNLANKTAQIANRFDTESGFISSSTRDVMSRYGISVVEANAMQSALTQMGLSESDIGRMTDAQKEAYNELMNYFQEGIKKIDPQKLEEFYDVMEEYQLATAKWKMDIQSTIMKIVAESDSFKRLIGSLQEFMEISIEFLESPAVQWFFDVFVEVLDTIVSFVNSIGKLFGFGTENGRTTTYTTNNSTNTYYIYGSDYSNNDELARSIALKQNTGGVG